MSEDQLQAFLAKVNTDCALGEKIKQAANIDAAIAIAKAEGFEINKQDWIDRAAELSDAELETMAGGAWTSMTNFFSEFGIACHCGATDDGMGPSCPGFENPQELGSV